MNLSIPTVEIAATTCPFGLVLSAEGRAAYANFFFLPSLADDVMARLVATPRYSDGSLRPHLWFKTKCEALHVRDILIARSGAVSAAVVKHR